MYCIVCIYSTICTVLYAYTVLVIINKLLLLLLRTKVKLSANSNYSDEYSMLCLL